MLRLLVVLRETLNLSEVGEKRNLKAKMLIPSLNFASGAIPVA